MSRFRNLRKLGTNNPWHLGDNSHPEVESEDTKTLLDRTLRRLIIPILTTELQTTSSSSIITFILSVLRDCGIIRHVVKPEWETSNDVYDNQSQTMPEFDGKTWQISRMCCEKFTSWWVRLQEMERHELWRYRPRIEADDMMVWYNPVEVNNHDILIFESMTKIWEILQINCKKFQSLCSWDVAEIPLSNLMLKSIMKVECSIKNGGISNSAFSRKKYGWHRVSKSSDTFDWTIMIFKEHHGEETSEKIITLTSEAGSNGRASDEESEDES